MNNIHLIITIVGKLLLLAAALLQIMGGNYRSGVGFLIILLGYELIGL